MVVYSVDLNLFDMFSIYLIILSLHLYVSIPIRTLFFSIFSKVIVFLLNINILYIEFFVQYSISMFEEGVLIKICISYNYSIFMIR